MAVLEIYQFPCLSDNYGFLVHDGESGETACIDTPETAPIMAALDKTGWTLTQIWNTHHHYDHKVRQFQYLLSWYHCRRHQ